jgi:hypothetical protein
MYLPEFKTKHYVILFIFSNRRGARSQVNTIGGVLTSMYI